MRGTQRLYTKQLRSKLTGEGLRPVWPLGKNLPIGAVGVLESGVLREVGSLKRLGISYDVRSDPVVDELSLSTGTSHSLDGDGELEVCLSSGGVKGALTGMFSLVFEASGWKRTVVENLSEVEAEIAKRDDWKPNWVIVYEVWSADWATVVMSAGGDAKVVFSAEGPLPDLSALGKVRAELSARVQSGNVLKVVGIANTSLAYSGVVARKRDGELRPVSTGRGGLPFSLRYVEDSDIEASWTDGVADAIRPH